MFIKAIPILPVNEMQAAIYFYENKLGFTAKNMGNWGLVKRGAVELQLQLIAGQPIKQTSCCIFTYNIEDYFVELSSKGLVKIAGRLQKNYEGLTEFFIHDIDGNTLYFRGLN